MAISSLAAKIERDARENQIADLPAHVEKIQALASALQARFGSRM